jgi:predicted metal-binding membrane protein
MQLSLVSLSLSKLRALRKPEGFALALTATLLAVTAAYLALMDWGMRNMDQAANMLLMPHMVAWGAVDLALVFLMWALMMIAMMAPSAYPAAKLVARGVDLARGAAAARRSVSAFLIGYLLAWIVFSVGATFLHWGMLSAALVSPMMVSVAPALSGLILIAAGAYQFAPLKRACLRQCQSPLWLIHQSSGWRGAAAMREGLRLGTFCVGCCWALMAVLFVTGVMNPLWVVLLAIYVLVEKNMPHQDWIPRLAGISLMAWGAWLLLSMGQ